MLGQLLGGRPQAAQYWAPYGVDIHEDVDHIVVEAELPGFTKEQVNITMENQTLTISADRNEDQNKTGESKGQTLLNERRFTHVERSFTLPPTVDEKSVAAKLSDGLLTITLKKREESKPRRVQVG
jgi:HSP20 family protein